jgi:N-acetylglutamate synthase
VSASGPAEPSASADAAAHSLLAVWAYLCSAIPQAWSRQHDGAMAGVTGLPLAMMNGVWIANETASPDVVSGLVSEVAASALPYCIQMRPGSSEALLRLPSTLGLHPHEDVPRMSLSRLDAVDRTLAQATVQLRALAPAEAALHCRLAAHGFGIPIELFATVVSPATLRLPGVRAYVAEVNGEPRSTALAVALDGYVGIFNVATPATHRRRGFGAAVTAIAVRDAFAAGAGSAWLQTTSLGRSVYEQLGFATDELWKSWASVPSSG